MTREMTLMLAQEIYTWADSLIVFISRDGPRYGFTIFVCEKSQLGTKEPRQKPLLIMETKFHSRSEAISQLGMSLKEVVSLIALEKSTRGLEVLERFPNPQNLGLSNSALLNLELIDQITSTLAEQEKLDRVETSNLLRAMAA